MFAETGLLFPYLQNYSQEYQQLEEYCMTHKSNASMSDLVQSSAMSEFDLFVEGDLFKAPETIIEEPEMDLDQMQAAMSMMSGGEDMSSQGLKSSDIDGVLQSEQLLSEVYYDCKKDLLEKAAIESPLSEILEIKIPALNIDENAIQENKPIPDVLLSKSVSSGNLSSMDWMHGPAMKPAFLDFPGIDFNAVYGMRRAFSEGDIKVNLKQFMYFVCASYKLNNIYGHFVKHYMLYWKKSKSHVEKRQDLDIVYKERQPSHVQYNTLTCWCIWTQILCSAAHGERMLLSPDTSTYNV